jgi:polyisoprenoid-binding protein YceI
MRNWQIFLFFILLWISGCSGEPEGEKEGIDDLAKIRASRERTTYKIDTATSIITWVGSSETDRHNGIFKIKEGSIILVSLQNPADSQSVNLPTKKDLDQIREAHVTINVNSMDILDLKHDPARYSKLLKHLKSDDFFHTEKYPEATFELTAIEPIKKDSVDRTENEFNIIDPTHRIKGNLTIKGVTQSIEFPVRLGLINLKLEASAKFNIDRTNWGISQPEKKDSVYRSGDGLINNIVNLGFEIIAYSQDP